MRPIGYDGSPMRTDSSTARRLLVAAALAVACASATIGWYSAAHLETLWDEPIDQAIADGLRDHPFAGGRPVLDPSQLRLPMYVTAFADAFSGRSDLAFARGVSLCAGAITVLATALLGARLFGPMAGFLAALLLGLSPYFLAYSRVAMTEGDVFLACFMTLAVWAFMRHLERPTPANWLTAAVFLAMALGAKAFAIVLLPVYAVMRFSAPRPVSPSFATAATPGERRRLHRLLTIDAIFAAGVCVTAAFSRQAAVAGWAVLAVLWLATVVTTLRMRTLPRGDLSQLVGLAVLAGVTFCVLMPVHLIEHEIVREFGRRLLGRSDNAASVSLADHLRLYSGILLIKMTVPLGVLTVCGLGYGIVRARHETAWRVCVLTVLLYLAGLCLLPLRQSFYLMGVYPLVAVIAAGFAVGIGRRLRKLGLGGLAVGWAVVMACSVSYLGWNVHQAYPYFHLFGYETIGDRWLGAESRGYRNLIQTPSDGVESLIRWVTAEGHVRPGSRVVSLLWEDMPGHIVDRLLPPQLPFTFVRRGLQPDSGLVPPPPSIDDADYVLLHINNFLGYGDRPPDNPPRELLDAQFEPAYVVRRGEIEVAWVYRRR